MDQKLESVLRRVELKRQYLPDKKDLDLETTAGLAQRFQEAFDTEGDLRYLNVSIKLVDRLEAMNPESELLVELRNREARLIGSLSAQWEKV